MHKFFEKSFYHALEALPITALCLYRLIICVAADSRLHDSKNLEALKVLSQQLPGLGLFLFLAFSWVLGYVIHFLCESFWLKVGQNYSKGKQDKFNKILVMGEVKEWDLFSSDMTSNQKDEKIRTAVSGELRRIALISSVFLSCAIAAMADALYVYDDRLESESRFFLALIFIIMLCVLLWHPIWPMIKHRKSRRKVNPNVSKV